MNAPVPRMEPDESLWDDLRRVESLLERDDRHDVLRFEGHRVAALVLKEVVARTLVRTEAACRVCRPLDRSSIDPSMASRTQIAARRVWGH
jgi:hypothetical protein